MEYCLQLHLLVVARSEAATVCEVDLPILLFADFRIHEQIKVAEDIWLDVVQKREKFLRVVLNRSACQKHDFSARMLLKKSQGLGSLILQSVSFVDDDELEWNVGQALPQIRIEDLVAGDHEVELAKSTFLSHRSLIGHVSVEPLLLHDFSPALSAFIVVVHDNIHKSPLFCDHLPVTQSTQRCNHEEWTSDFANLNQMVQKCDRLDGLSKSHLICQNNVDVA